MSNRRKLRMPGRYERSADMRPPLGDTGGELAFRVAWARHRDADEPRPVRRHVATVEAAPATEVVRLHEAVGGQVREAPQPVQTGGGGLVIPIDVIKSGWNSSGSRYYPAGVLERDIPLVYPKGTHQHLDHPSASETDDRPERSVRTLAAVFLEDPYPVREGDRVIMRTTARVFSTHAEFIREAWEAIGVSINGSGVGAWGSAEGREGTVMESLTYGQSVDFVTKPGAGGRVLGLMESAREDPLEVTVTREAGSLGAYLESRMHLGFTQLADDLYGDGRFTRAERITMSSAVGDGLSAFVARIEADAPQVYQRGRWAEPTDGADEAMSVAEAARVTREASAEETRNLISDALNAVYSGEGRYAYVSDYDPDNGVVWFHAGDADGAGTYQQSYATGVDGAVALTGARVKVTARTVYEPVDRPTTSTAEAVADAGVAVVVTAEADTTTETPAGDPPADSDTGPHVPAITKEAITMAEKTAEVVAREAAEAARDEAIQTAESTRLLLARYQAGDAAAPIVGQLVTESALPAPAQARIRAQFGAASLPLLESTRALDETALRTQAAAAITAEADYVAQILESAGVGQVTGNGAAAGAGTGMPAAFGASTATSTTEAADMVTARESLIAAYTARGMTREAALKAAAGRI